MNLDEIPERLEELFDRSRAALDQQIAKARKVVDSLNVEKTAAAKALGELKDQITKARAELDAVRADLGRASTAVQLDREIKKSRSELERLKGETAEEEKTLAALTKKRTEAEARVIALENDARQATAERCRAQDMMEQVKAKLRSITLPA